MANLASIGRFHNSDLSRFVNNTVQETLLIIVLGNVDKDVDTDSLVYRKINDMPVNIRENRLLSHWQTRDERIPIPSNSEIKSIDPRKRFFIIESPYGGVRFTWELAVTNSAFHSEPYLQVHKGVSKDDCCDIFANVTVSTKIKYGRILSPRTKNFAEWATAVSKRVDNLDWQNTISKFPTVILQDIAGKI